MRYNQWMLAGEINQFFKGEVWTDDKTLEEYSHDASIFEVKPQVVVAGSVNVSPFYEWAHLLIAAIALLLTGLILRLKKQSA